MGWKVFKKENFYFNFSEKRLVPDIYASIHHAENPIVIYANQVNKNIQQSIGTYVVELFPSYFTFEINSGYRLVLKKIFRVKGYCISIGQLGSIDEYLEKHFKPNFRTSLRRRLKGLETCFNVSYKMFYGHIDQGEYNYVMSTLHTMLIRRFDQRNDKNTSLLKWKDYYNNTFALINQSKASLYVIYDDKKPIQISLNFHYDKIMFLSIPSYDIDYSKFGLGNISVQNLLEWCIANQYEILDMGYGAFDYKVKWCNEIYDFEHHLFYNRSSVFSRILIKSITIKTQLINFLIAKKVNIHYHRMKSFFLGKKKSDLLAYRVEKVDFNMEFQKDIKPVDPMFDESYAFLRKSVFDFVYTHLEHISKIQVYELESNKSFVIKGVKQAQKIIYNSQ